jgi:hypothetical protein
MFPLSNIPEQEIYRHIPKISFPAVRDVFIYIKEILNAKAQIIYLIR